MKRLVDFLVKLSTSFPHATTQCVADETQSETQSETVQHALGQHYLQFRENPVPAPLHVGK
jgi:hypothetical protein